MKRHKCVSVVLKLLIVAGCWSSATILFAEGNSFAIDIVSPKTCKTSADVLSNCQVSTPQFSTLYSQFIGMSLDVKWKKETSGDCRGRYPLQVNIVNAEGDEFPINLSTTAAGSLKAPISSFKVVGTGFWQDRAYFDSSCRISLTIDVSGLSDAAFVNSLNSLIEGTPSEIPAKEKRLVKLQSQMISLAGQKESFACMIQAYDSPLTDSTLLAELKTQYNTLYHEEYETGRYSCPPSITLDEELKKCADSDRAEEIICVYNTSYEQAKEWFKEKMDECDSYSNHLASGTLKDKLTELKQNLNDSLSKARVGITK